MFQLILKEIGLFLKAIGEVLLIGGLIKVREYEAFPKVLDFKLPIVANHSAWLTDDFITNLGLK